MAVPEDELRRRTEAFVLACRRIGLKVTYHRMEVFRELAATDEHPDAETIFQRVRRRIPVISRDTVYRALAGFHRAGLVRRLDVPGSAARYDAGAAPHHHFVCTECGAVADFFSRALDKLPIPASVGRLGRVRDVCVQVRGTCAACGSRGRGTRSGRGRGRKAPRRAAKGDTAGAR